MLLSTDPVLEEEGKSHYKTSSVLHLALQGSPYDVFILASLFLLRLITEMCITVSSEVQWNISTEVI